MIGDHITHGLALYLKERLPAALQTQIFEQQMGEDLSYPAIITEVSDEPEPHEVIPGVFTYDAVVTLKTHPEDDPDASQHRGYNTELQRYLCNTDAVRDFLSSLTEAILDETGDPFEEEGGGGPIETEGRAIKCWDVWGGSGYSDEEDGYRLTFFPLQIIASN